MLNQFAHFQTSVDSIGIHSIHDAAKENLALREEIDVNRMFEEIMIRRTCCAASIGFHLIRAPICWAEL